MYFCVVLKLMPPESLYRELVVECKLQWPKADQEIYSTTLVKHTKIPWLPSEMKSVLGE